MVHEALEKELFPTLTSNTIVDVNGKNIVTYKLSNEVICDKVRIMMDGVPSTNPNEYAFYSTDYGRITHKHILKICRDRFSAEPDSIGTGKEKVRALTFDKEIVEKVGKTFDIISEIKIVKEPLEDGEAKIQTNRAFLLHFRPKIVPAKTPKITLIMKRLGRWDENIVY